MTAWDRDGSTRRTVVPAAAEIGVNFRSTVWLVASAESDDRSRATGAPAVVRFGGSIRAAAGATGLAGWTAGTTPCASRMETTSAIEAKRSCGFLATIRLKASSRAGGTSLLPAHRDGIGS